MHPSSLLQYRPGVHDEHPRTSKIVGITKHTIIAIEYNKWVDGNLLQLNYTLMIEKQKITDTRKQKTAFETDYVRQEQEKVLACLE